MELIKRLIIILMFLTIALSSLSAASALSQANSKPNPTEGVPNSAFGTYNYPIHQMFGPHRTLAILVEFSDVKHSQNRSSVDDLIFRQMAHYFTDASYGQFQIVGKSIGWYLLPHTMSYYGADLSTVEPGSDARILPLIQDTFDAVTDQVNFSDYSEFMTVHAGMGQEDAVKETDLIWSQAFLPNGELSIPTKQGITIHSVAIVPERESDDHSPLGVYAHEYGHLLSLPDLFDSYRVDIARLPDDFVGKWSLEGTGVWLGNPNGTSPAGMESWSRIKLGWLVPDTLELTPGNPSFYYETLSPLEEPNGIRAIQIPLSQSEYYLIEFRIKVNYDKELPGEGVLITRVDETKAAEGVVRVIDANLSSPTLDDATYHKGGLFNDTTNRVFVYILAGNPTAYSVLIGNRPPVSFPIIATKVAGPATLNTTYSQSTTFSTRLTDISGKPLSSFPVHAQYYYNESWIDFDSALSDAVGNASFNERLTLRPGSYPIRYLFKGGSVGTMYFAGTDQPATLNVGKLVTFVQLQVSETVEATTSTAMTIRISDEYGNRAKDMQLLVRVDGQLVRTIDHANGTMSIPLSFGMLQLGEHTIQVQVESNAFYEGSSGSAHLNVTGPMWFYGFLAVVLIVSSAALYQVIRIRKRHDLSRYSLFSWSTDFRT